MNPLYKIRVLIGDAMWWFLNASYNDEKWVKDGSVKIHYDNIVTGGGGAEKSASIYKAGDTVTMNFEGGSTTIRPAESTKKVR